MNKNIAAQSFMKKKNPPELIDNLLFYNFLSALKVILFIIHFNAELSSELPKQIFDVNSISGENKK